MSTSEASQPSAKPKRDIPWKRFLVLGVVIIVLALVAYLFIALVMPQWWAHTIGGQVHGSMSTGIGLGLFYGFVFTLVPLLVAGLAFARRWGNIVIRIVFIVVGVLLAAPNLMTLSIVLGNSNAAHDAE